MSAKWVAERIVLAIDVRLEDGGTPVAQTHGWTRGSGVTLWSLLDRYLAAIGAA